MSDTPRTDKEAIGFARLLVDHETFDVTEIIPADFSRQLEREIERLTAELEQSRAELLETQDAESKADLEMRFEHYKQRAESVEAKNASLVAQVSITKDLLLEAKELLRHTSCKYPREGEFPCQACLMEEKIDSINITAEAKKLMRSKDNE